MTTDLSLAVIDGEPRIDSRIVAGELGVAHEAVQKLVDKYSAHFQELGLLRFEIGAVKRDGERGIKYEKFYLFNEDQTYFAMTLVRNTDQSVRLKQRLVKVFAECRAMVAAPTARTLFGAAEECEMLRAQLAACHAELIQVKPVWAKIARYKTLGLNHVEIGLLTARHLRNVRRNVRRIEACGLLPARDSMQLSLLEG